jgi:hypothetical protein
VNPVIAYLCCRAPLYGGEWYRATRPAALLNRNFGWGSAVCDRMATEGETGPLSFVTPNEMVVTPNIIVLRPIREWTQAWTDRAHANGQLVIADLDDDYWAHQDWEGETRPNDDGYDDWFWNVDAVLVSTKYLKKRIIDMGHKSPVVVASNCYSPYELDANPHPSHTIGTRLWLSGRMEGDLVMYDELVKPLLEEYDLSFHHVGAEDGHRFSDRGWDPGRLIEVGAVPVPLLPQALEGVSMGMICMSEHPYNLAKTETHAVELASMGIPLVAASKHALYRNIPGLVDSSPAGVGRRVEALLNPIYWRAESESARAWARRLSAKNEIQYLGALTNLLDVLRSS